MFKTRVYFCAASIILSAILLSCASLEVLPEAEKTVETVYEVPGLSKDQIYDASLAWIAQNFRSAKSVVEMDNRAAGVLIGNGIIAYPCEGAACIGKGNWKVGFTMQCDVKDAKFKLLFTNVRVLVPGEVGVRPSAENPIYWSADMQVIRPKLLALGESLRDSTRKSKSDW